MDIHSAIRHWETPDVRTAAGGIFRCLLFVDPGGAVLRLVIFKEVRF
ncbi:MAG: hypothetical protein ABIT05_13455 [Chitinophagaceae bacterium]